MEAPLPGATVLHVIMMSRIKAERTIVSCTLMMNVANAENEASVLRTVLGGSPECISSMS